MGRQVNFLMHPLDLAEFEQALRARGEVCFIEARLQTPMINRLSTLAIARTGERGVRGYLARESDLAKIITEAVPEQQYWLVDLDRSPAIQFDSGFFDGKVIRRGRLYYQPGFWSSYEDDACWVEKPKEFIRWADGILRWVRRHYTIRPVSAFYVGPHAWEWFNQEAGREFDVGWRSNPVSPLTAGG